MTDELARTSSRDFPHNRAASAVLRAMAWCEANGRQLAIGAVALSVVLAGGYALLLGDQLRYYDEQEYASLARSLAEGHGFSYDNVHPSAYRPPGYPLLLGAAYLSTSGSVLGMRLVGVLALAGTVWLVYLLGRRAHSRAVGALASLIVACYPLLVYTSTTLYPQVPAVCLLLLQIELALRATTAKGMAPTRYRWTCTVTAGFAGGLMALTVPTHGPSAAAVILWLAWRHRRSIDRRSIYQVLAVMTIAVAVLPVAWGVRNAVELHALVPVSTNTGMNLLLGNSEHVTPGAGRASDISDYTQQAAALQLDEVEQNQYYTQAALGWISEHPRKAITLYLGKVVNTFSFSNELATPGQSSTTKDLLSALTYYPLLALSLVRVLLMRRWPLRPVEKLFVGLVIANVLLQALFFTRLRFRVPLDVLTILLAATAMGYILRWRSSCSAG